EFGNEKFTFKEAQKTLGDDSRIVNLCLSELKKFGWLESQTNPDDTRRKLYHLEELTKAYKEITKEIVRTNGK
ncbi:unnamed protein product, partial [marine sediment metagenome]